MTDPGRPDQPAPPQPPGPGVDTIVAPRPPAGDGETTALARHFSEHEGGFTRDALSESAARAGHSPAAIAAAWRMADEASRSRDAADGTAEETSRRRKLARAILVALYVGTFVALVVPTGMGQVPAGADPMTSRPTTYGIGQWILGGLLLIIGLAGYVSIGRRRRLPANTGLALTSLLAVPVVMLLIVAGSCLWAAGPELFGERG